MKKKENKNSEILKLLKENYEIKSAGDIANALKDLFKDTLQDMMNAEFEDHMGYEKNDNEVEKENYRNGSYEKKLKSTYGEIPLEIPRDRNSEFNPVVVPKHKRDISDIEEKIIGLYSRGISTREISDEIRELYGIEVSATMVSNITEAVLPRIKEWQNRRLLSVYPILFIDAVHFNVREDNRVVKKAAYIVLGYDSNGNKDILGIWIGENESAKFWLSVLNDLKNRGVSDILILCSDGLTGIKEAITAAYPKTVQQRCIVHMIRNSIKFIGYKDYKKFCSELKSVYGANNEDQALEALDEMESRWGDKYPSALKVWRKNWDEISHMFHYSPSLRKVIYTTNAIESLNRSFRKYTKTKGTFPTDDSLMKSLYLSTMNIMKKWTMRCHNWDLIINELEILFENRI